MDNSFQDREENIKIQSEENTNDVIDTIQSQQTDQYFPKNEDSSLNIQKGSQITKSNEQNNNENRESQSEEINANYEEPQHLNTTPEIIPEDNEGQNQQFSQEQSSQVEFIPPQIVRNLSFLISSLGNEAFLQVQYLDAIADFLGIQQTIFEDFVIDINECDKRVEAMLLDKRKLLELAVQSVMRQYDQLNVQGNLNILERMMKILKSKEKRIYISKDVPQFVQCIHNQVRQETQEQQSSGQNHENTISEQQNENHETVRDDSQLENKINQIYEINQEQKEESQMDIQNNSDQKFTLPTVNHITCFDLFGIMSLKTLNMNQLENFDPDENALIFRLHDLYKVKIMGIQKEAKRVINSDSLFSSIPSFIMMTHIFPFFSALELFKMRIICGEWKDLVRQTWHIIFKREMFEQLLSRDLQQDILQQTKMLLIRSPFMEKIQILLRAMIELIVWPTFLSKLEERKIELPVKLVVIAILKLLGEDVPVDFIQNYDDCLWEINKEKIMNLKEMIERIFQPNYKFPSKKQLQIIKDRFLMSSDLGLSNFIQGEDKNGMYLTICANQIYFYGLLKTQIFAQEVYLQALNSQLELLKRRQSPNKNFLEGAYKMLLLRTSIINQGKIVSDITEDSSEEENDEESEQENQSYGQQFIQALMNLSVNQLKPDIEPDIVIKKKKKATHIYIDINTKIDIVLSSLQVFNQKPEGQQEQETSQTSDFSSQFNQDQIIVEDEKTQNQNTKEQTQDETQ